MLGTIKQTFYEKDNFFSIKGFIPDTPVEVNGEVVSFFSIKGSCLPRKGKLDLSGKFESKYYPSEKGNRYTYVVTSFKDVKNPGREGVTEYLESLEGCGKVFASRIYDHFGEQTYEILSTAPERLSEIEGLGPKTREAIALDYLLRNDAQVLFWKLAPLGVTRTRIVRLFRDFKGDALRMISTNPHELTLKRYLSFSVAEKIAEENGLLEKPGYRFGDARIRACVLNVLNQTENKGSTYVEWGDLLKYVDLTLKVDSESRQTVNAAVRDVVKGMGYDSLYNANSVNGGKPIFYRKETGESEYGTARKVRQLLMRDHTNKDYIRNIKRSEKKLGVSLSEEQESAVNMVMNNALSVVTGGPGTGKTTFQKVLMDVYKTICPGKPIMLAAPTGRAARRMTEAADDEEIVATTIHKLLQISATDDGDMIQNSWVKLPAGLLIVDEVSMLDIFVSKKLFDALSEETKIVCIGDAFQLPSVGAGAVLKSFIDCGRIPTVTFTKIFRQAGDSAIAENAMKINHGDTDLIYDDTFRFIEAKTSEQIVKVLKEEYVKAVDNYGMEDVAVLTPYRRKTATGVNELNPVLRDLIMPDKENLPKITDTNIYLYDRVMFTKNIGEKTNGEIGYVTAIETRNGMQIVSVRFDDRMEKLTGDELKYLVPAYAITVHKSQGSEYGHCIIVVDPAHKNLLSRNIVYTAITRAKKGLVIVGCKAEFISAILRQDESMIRKTQLSDLLR